MLILKNSSLLSFNQFFTSKELLIFNTLLFQYKVLKKSSIEISDLKSKMGIKYSQNKHLKQVLLDFSSKVVKPTYINKLKDIEEKYITFFDFIKIDKKIIDFQFSKDLLDYIDSKDSSFYNLDFNKIVGIKNIHSITLYELVLDFTLKNQKITTLYFNFNFLRKILGLETKYYKNSEFKTKVVNKIIKSFEIFESIKIELLEKNKKYILKISNDTSALSSSFIEEVTNWFNANADEVELYKETLLATNDNLDSKLLQFDHVKKQSDTFFAVFKYNSFLLEVEIIQEDLDIILDTNKEVESDA